jgi:hypothetical protein
MLVGVDNGASGNVTQTTRHEQAEKPQVQLRPSNVYVKWLSKPPLRTPRPLHWIRPVRLPKQQPLKKQLPKDLGLARPDSVKRQLRLDRRRQHRRNPKPSPSRAAQPPAPPPAGPAIEPSSLASCCSGIVPFERLKSCCRVHPLTTGYPAVNLQKERPEKRGRTRQCGVPLHWAVSFFVRPPRHRRRVEKDL